MKNYLSRFFRNYSRGRQARSFAGTLLVGGYPVSDLHLLGGYHRPGITKAGRLSVKGLCDGRVVKVYSAHSAVQVRLRLALQEAILPSGMCFPEIVASDDHLVAERWVEGTSLTRLRGKPLADAAERVRHFLGECAGEPRLLELARRYDGSFCYLEDYLLQRLGAWRNVREIAMFVEKWQDEYARVKSVLPRRLTHPDLSLANLLLEKGTERLFIVDNELLGVGAGWILDWHNSLLRERQLPLLEPSRGETERFIQMTWRLRRLGSALDGGDFRRALEIVAE